jgi:hypothetical protein
MKIRLIEAASSYANRFSGVRIISKTALLRNALLLFILITAFSTEVRAQDPVLPSTDLGLADVYDGFGKPGLYLQEYAQIFQTRGFYDQSGKRSPSDLKINSFLLMNQLLYVSKVKVLEGNLGFTVLVPVVQINVSSPGGTVPTTNPGVVGDPIAGAAVEWSNKKLFGKTFFHRLEFDVSVPIGNYGNRYIINPSAHLWNYEAYYAFTIVLNKTISVSTRTQLNYNEHIIGTEDKPGAFYNGNYSVEFSVAPALKVEAVSYYLTQFNQDKHNGSSQYYQDQFGIYNTKERVLAVGPGIAYFIPNGVLLEAKVFFETDVQNRFAGTRPTLHMVIPLTK